MMHGVDTGRSCPPIAGIGRQHGAAVSSEKEASITFRTDAGGSSAATSSGAAPPDARRSLVSENCLVKLGLTIVKGPSGCFISEDPIDQSMVSDSTTLKQSNGLYFIPDASFGSPAASPEVNAALDAKRDFSLWATRLHTDESGLAKARVHTSSIPKATPALIEALQHDIARRGANLKRRPVKRAKGKTKRSTKVGRRWVIDGQGPFNTKSVIDGSVYLTAIDEASTYGVVEPTVVHGTDEWVDYVGHLKALSSEHGHEMKYVRVDRAPEFASDEFRKRAGASTASSSSSDRATGTSASASPRSSTICACGATRRTWRASRRAVATRWPRSSTPSTSSTWASRAARASRDTSSSSVSRST